MIECYEVGLVCFARPEMGSNLHFRMRVSKHLHSTLIPQVCYSRLSPGMALSSTYEYASFWDVLVVRQGKYGPTAHWRCDVCPHAFWDRAPESVVLLYTISQHISRKALNVY